MKLLVTGGAGFIGTNFIRYWLANNPSDEIINIDKLTYASDLLNLKNVKTKENYSFVKGDIANKNLMLKLAERVDTIVNFAAESHVDNSIKNSYNFIKSNIVGVHAILEAVRKTRVRFHQISTDEVYGSLPLNSKERFSENSKYAPKNPYAATKAAADHLVNSYFNTYKLDVTISNCSNNYGPFQHPEKLIPKSIINALSNKLIPIYGNGLQVRDWIYVEDHCSAIETIIKKGTFGETYLIGNNGEKCNIELIKLLLNKLGKSEKLIKFVGDRPGHDVRYGIDASKITNELNWHPKIDFKEGIDRTINFYKENFERYKNKMKTLT